MEFESPLLKHHQLIGTITYKLLISTILQLFINYFPTLELLQHVIVLHTPFVFISKLPTYLLDFEGYKNYSISDMLSTRIEINASPEVVRAKVCTSLLPLFFSFTPRVTHYTP
jgi:hypothetical protein